MNYVLNKIILFLPCFVFNFAREMNRRQLLQLAIFIVLNMYATIIDYKNTFLDYKTYSA